LLQLEVIQMTDPAPTAPAPYVINLICVKRNGEVAAGYEYVLMHTTGNTTLKEFSGRLIDSAKDLFPLGVRMKVTIGVEVLAE
jgi:hypothetical protein